MLPPGQICFSSGLLHVHQASIHFWALPFFKNVIQLEKQLSSNTLLLLHQVLGCVHVEGDPKEFQTWLEADEVVHFRDGGTLAN